MKSFLLKLNKTKQRKRLKNGDESIRSVREERISEGGEDNGREDYVTTE